MTPHPKRLRVLVLANAAKSAASACEALAHAAKAVFDETPAADPGAPPPAAPGPGVFFSVLEDGTLYQRVTLRGGRTYERRCPKKSLDAIVDAIEKRIEGDAGGFRIDEVAKATRLPRKQVCAVVDFMERHRVIWSSRGGKHRAWSIYDGVTHAYYDLREAAKRPVS